MIMPLGRLQKRLLVISIYDSVCGVNSTHRKTLAAIFSKPTARTLEWSRIESLLLAIGARAIEGRGSRVRFELRGAIAIFHRPHPVKEPKPYQVEDVRAFLIVSGVKP